MSESERRKRLRTFRFIMNLNHPLLLSLLSAIEQGFLQGRAGQVQTSQGYSDSDTTSVFPINVHQPTADYTIQQETNQFLPYFLPRLSPIIGIIGIDCHQLDKKEWGFNILYLLLNGNVSTCLHSTEINNISVLGRSTSLFGHLLIIHTRIISAISSAIHKLAEIMSTQYALQPKYNLILRDHC